MFCAEFCLLVCRYGYFAYPSHSYIYIERKGDCIDILTDGYYKGKLGIGG